jgi:hypothetical protein
MLAVGGVLLAGFIWVCGFASLFAAAYGTRPKKGSWAEWRYFAVENLIVFGPVVLLGCISAYWAWRHRGDFLSALNILFALAVVWGFLLTCALVSSFVLAPIYLFLYYELLRLAYALVSGG